MYTIHRKEKNEAASKASAENDTSNPLPPVANGVDNTAFVNEECVNGTTNDNKQVTVNSTL